MPESATYSLYPPQSPTPRQQRGKAMAFSFTNKHTFLSDSKARAQTRAGGVLGLGAPKVIRFNSQSSDRPTENIEPVTNLSNNTSSAASVISNEGNSVVAAQHVPTRLPSVIPEEDPQAVASSQDLNKLPEGGHRRNSDVGSELATPESQRERPSMSESAMTYETGATSVSTLPALQSKGPAYEYTQLAPVSEDDPTSYDLLAPEHQRGPRSSFSLEERGEQMFSTAHLQAIFRDPSSLMKFTSFLGTHRPNSVTILIYYLDALKALRAINYANAVAEALDPLPQHEFTNQQPAATRNLNLEEKARRAFQILVQEDLPAFVTDTWIRVVSASIQRRISGTLPPHLREASEGLAEVFCLSDPSRPDNPIVFASEEFHRTTQYGMNYAIGRNCRFLQGPRTNPASVRRLKEAVVAGKEHCETFVNYRRDGSPFMNLLMIAPLRDSRGTLRYYIGAQVDVTGLAKECTHLDALQRVLADEAEGGSAAEHDEKKDEFQELSEMFNMAELEIVRKHGGRMHREHEERKDSATSWHRPRLLLQDHSGENVDTVAAAQEPGHIQSHGKLSGVYQHYLLIRPYPSLRILFASPSLRVPGILQSPFMNRIGGSERVREELVAALADGRGVTAKIRWVSRSDDEGRNRWVHCTPLVGATGNIGVWMVVLVDEEASRPQRRFRPAPPVPLDINGKMYEPSRTPVPGGRRSATPGLGYEEKRRSNDQGSDFDFRI